MKRLKFQFLTLIVLLITLFASCEKDMVILTGLLPTYTIEDVTVQGQNLKKITGSINESITLSNSNSYLLSGIVFVEDTLTIEPGTIIYAETSPLTALVINRKARLEAIGTATAPIVFTSVNEIQGNGQSGDWGGIHINGQASLNTRSTALVDIIGKYGRTDNLVNDEDNSGVMKYLRVEFAGKDVNGSAGAFNLNAVGSETQIEYLQTYKSSGQGIRFRGGKARLKYALATQTIGKGYRWDAGWRGYGQFWIVNYTQAVQDTLIAIEGRSGAPNDPPVSAPILSNITIVGMGNTGADPQVRGIRFRDSTLGKVYNSIITQCRRAVRADYSQSTIDAGTLVFANNNLFYNQPDYYVGASGDTSVFGLPQYNNTTNVVSMNGYIGTDTGGTFSVQTIDSWFNTINYKGAVPSGNNWTQGWTR